MFSDVNLPTASVSDLPVGVNTLTWVVESALGICAAQPATVDITVNALPAAIDPAPSNLCETIAGLGIAISANLTSYNESRSLLDRVN
jgi:hypothetical protein